MNRRSYKSSVDLEVSRPPERSIARVTVESVLNPAPCKERSASASRTGGETVRRRRPRRRASSATVASRARPSPRPRIDEVTTIGSTSPVRPSRERHAHRMRQWRPLTGPAPSAGHDASWPTSKSAASWCAAPTFAGGGSSHFPCSGLKPHLAYRLKPRRHSAADDRTRAGRQLSRNGGIRLRRDQNPNERPAKFRFPPTRSLRRFCHS